MTETGNAGKNQSHFAIIIAVVSGMISVLTGITTVGLYFETRAQRLVAEKMQLEAEKMRIEMTTPSLNCITHYSGVGPGDWIGFGIRNIGNSTVKLSNAILWVDGKDYKINDIQCDVAAFARSVKIPADGTITTTVEGGGLRPGETDVIFGYRYEVYSHTTEQDKIVAAMHRMGMSVSYPMPDGSVSTGNYGIVPPH